MANNFKSISTNTGIASSIASGGTTRDNTLGLSGTANTPIKRVGIYDGDTFLGNASLKNGNWSFNTGALSDGTHTLTARFFGKTTSTQSVRVTIDTRPPTGTFAPTMLTNVEAQTLITSGQSTVDKTLGLSGTAEVGSKVAIYDGNTLLGNATMTANGSWTFTTPQLTPGQHQLKAVISDAAGNQTTVAGPTANLLAIGTLASSVTTDSGATQTISNGGATKDNTPTLTGTALAGTSVSVYDGNTLLGQVPVNSSGTWTYTTPLLADGAHDLKVRFTTANETYDTAINITVDTAADFSYRFLPTINRAGEVNSGLNPAEGFLGNRIGLTVLDTDNDTLSNVVKFFDNGQFIGNASTNNGIYWRLDTPDLAPGNHHFTAQVVDLAGNIANIDGYTVTVVLGRVSDHITTSSGITPNIGNGGLTRDNTLGFTGKAIAGTRVSIYEGQNLLATTIAGTDGNWSATMPGLADGGHNFRFEYANGVSTQTETKTLSATIDSVAPVGSFDSMSNTAAISPIVTGTAEAGSTVAVYDGNNLLGTATRSGTSWQFDTLALSQTGTHTFKAKVIDAAGNEAWVAGPSLDLLAYLNPSITTNTGHAPSVQSGGFTSDNTLNFNGTALAGAVVRVYEGNQLLGTSNAGSTGEWSFTTQALADGLHTFHTDVAVGTKSASSRNIAVTVDQIAPSAPIMETTIQTNLGDVSTIQSGGRTVDHTLGLNGTAEAGAMIKMYDGTKYLGSTFVDTNAQWSFLTPALASGTHSLKALVIDAAGNESPYSNVVTVQINAAPALPAFNHKWSTDSGWGEIDALAALRAATGRALPDVIGSTEFTYIDGVAAANMNDAHYYGYTGSGVTIAIVDSGLSTVQEGLSQAKISPYAWDFADNDAVPQDTIGHGTFVASQIAGQGNLEYANYDFIGGAYGATLMPLRIDYSNLAHPSQALRYAVDHGADIVNMSLFVGNNDEEVGAMRSAIQHAKDHDVLVVVSAGNQRGNPNPFYPAAFAKEFSNVIAVGVMHDSAGYHPTKEHFPLCNDAGAGPYAYVDALAVNTFGFFETGGLVPNGTGSSFAAPLVSAEAALLLEANPLLSAAQIASLITHTAHALPTYVL